MVSVRQLKRAGKRETGEKPVRSRRCEGKVLLTRPLE